jgi:hypothetical protein
LLAVSERVDDLVVIVLSGRPIVMGDLLPAAEVVSAGCDAPAFPYGHGLTVDQAHRPERPERDDSEELV